MKILIIEDNKNLAKSIARVLQQEKFSIEIQENGAEAENFWIQHHSSIDCVLLDIQLPEKNGFEICKNIREKNISTPVIMLTAKGEVESRVQGLQSGADDYLTKPFSFDELLARIFAVLRRPQIIQQKKIWITEEICFQKEKRSVQKKNLEISLTPKEFEILEFLVENKNRAVSQQQIFEHCFDFAKDNWSNTIEVHIKNLRKKLFKDCYETPLKTVRGIGYCLEIK